MKTCFLRRKLPRIRKAAGPYAFMCVRALTALREGTDPDPEDLLVLTLAAEKVLEDGSWTLKELRETRRRQERG